jgi:2-phospho-L-lactate guanylyltransferase
MDLRVIIPVKPFGEAKQRLAPVLNSTERTRLAERMFRHVLHTASKIFGAPNILVVSRAEDISAVAEAEGALNLLERGPSDLNSALLQAARFANARGNSRLLILASDLPLLDASDLMEMAKYDCAIAPDRHGQGTNALVWPAHLPFHFGENSFMRHRTAAESAGLIPRIVARRGLQHDVDVPEDLTEIGAQPNLERSSGRTRSA